MKLQIDLCAKYIHLNLKKLCIAVTVSLGLCIPQTLYAEPISCNIYQMQIDQPTSFDDLKKINFSDFIQDHFLSLQTSLQASEIIEDLKVNDNGKEVTPQEAILALPDTVQDIFWINSIAFMSDNSYYFKTESSDFAPYVYRALKRQKLTQEVEIFANAMAVFGNRYDGFDENAKTIRTFPITLSQADFDKDLEKLLDSDNTTEEWLIYKQAMREIRIKILTQEGNSARANISERQHIYKNSLESIKTKKI